MRPVQNTEGRRQTWAALGIIFLLIALPSPATDVREVSVPMRDGVALKADLYLPAATGTFDTVLIRTPYGKRGMAVIAEKFVARSYAVMIQDVRGKYASGGEFLPFINETGDGLDTLDWIAKSEWSNKRVALWGSSYLAMCGLLVAREGHPALRAVFSASGWTEGEGINVAGGAMHIGLAIPWLLFEGGKSQRSLKHFDLDELFRHKPLRGVFSLAGVEMPAWLNPAVLHNERAPLNRMKVPVFHMTGWYDFVSPASLAIWRDAATSQPPQRLMIGPWIHDQFWDKDTVIGEVDAGPQAVLGVDRVVAIAADWFDVHLRGDSRPESAPVNVFVFGENRWHAFPTWPPPKTTKRSLYLHNDRTLSGALPSRRRTSDAFTFDPEQPVPTIGGANFHFFANAGIRDQSEIEHRPDVLVYTSPPLERDLLLAGPVHAVIHVSTEGRDTDFTAKLVHVTPDGRSFNIVDGILRLSLRNGGSKRNLVQPGRVYEITIDLGQIAISIPKGHRLRLDISSSNFPKFDRNPNTGEEPLDAMRFRVVRQTVHHSRAYPSRVEITVMEGEDR